MIRSQFIVISEGGPHPIGWRAIFIDSSHRKCLNFYIERPLFLQKGGSHNSELITNNSNFAPLNNLAAPMKSALLHSKVYWDVLCGIEEILGQVRW